MLVLAKQGLNKIPVTIFKTCRNIPKLPAGFLHRYYIIRKERGKYYIEKPLNRNFIDVMKDTYEGFYAIKIDKKKDIDKQIEKQTNLKPTNEFVSLLKLYFFANENEIKDNIVYLIANPETFDIYYFDKEKEVCYLNFNDFEYYLGVEIKKDNDYYFIQGKKILKFSKPIYFFIDLLRR